MTMPFHPALQHAITVDIAFVLGETRLTLGRVLQLQRGAVIVLDDQAQAISITANRHPVASGQLLVMGDAMALKIAAPETQR